VSIAWYRVANTNAVRYAAFAMPAAMAFTVVVTANHWVLDIVAGGVVSLAGLAIHHSGAKLLAPLNARRLARALMPADDRLVLHVEAINHRRLAEEARARARTQHFL